MFGYRAGVYNEKKLYKGGRVRGVGFGNWFCSPPPSPFLARGGILKGGLFLLLRGRSRGFPKSTWLKKEEYLVSPG